MRPRDQDEIARCLMGLRQAQQAQQARPALAPSTRRILQWALLAVLVIEGALLFWRQRRDLAVSCRSGMSFAVEWLGLDAVLQSQPQAQPAATPAAAEPLSLVSAAPAAAPLPAVAASTGPAAPAAKPPRPDYWLIRGLVYDLYSLKPVSGAQVSFVSHSTGEKLLASTDRTGHYSLKASRLSSGGYDVTIRHPRYHDNYLDENDPPYRQLGLERRKDAGTLFLQSDVLHVPFLPPFDEDRPWLDLVLMPR